MKAFVAALFLGVASVPSFVSAAGFAFTDRVSVMAPDQETAEAVLAKAELCCREIARSWLGEESPTLNAPIAIHVRISGSEDWGLTWPIDSPRRTVHRVWLNTSRARALGSALEHEMVHAFFCARFRERLPAWAEEAIAGSYDDPGRAAVCRQAVARLARSGNWPDLEKVFNAASLAPTDETAYGVAGSVAQYLLRRGEKAAFVRFAQSGKAKGWSRALEEHYGYSSVAQFQQAWQQWASRSSIAAELTSLEPAAQ